MNYLSFSDCVMKLFGADSFDMRILKRKCNQKCRDTNRKYAKMQSSIVEERGVEQQPPGDEDK